MSDIPSGALEAGRIVYVSCNPTTLAPNAAQLVEFSIKAVAHHATVAYKYRRLGQQSTF